MKFVIAIILWIGIFAVLFLFIRKLVKYFINRKKDKKQSNDDIVIK